MLCLCGNKLGPYKRKHCSYICFKKYDNARRINRKKIKLSRQELIKLKPYLHLLYRGRKWFKLNHKETYIKFKNFLQFK